MNITYVKDKKIWALVVLGRAIPITPDEVIEIELTLGKLESDAYDRGMQNSKTQLKRIADFLLQKPKKDKAND